MYVQMYFISDSIFMMHSIMSIHFSLYNFISSEYKIVTILLVSKTSGNIEASFKLK